MLAGEQAVTTAAPFEWDVDMFLDPERMMASGGVRHPGSGLTVCRRARVLNLLS